MSRMSLRSSGLHFCTESLGSRWQPRGGGDIRMSLRSSGLHFCTESLGSRWQPRGGGDSSRFDRVRTGLGRSVTDFRGQHLVDAPAVEIEDLKAPTFCLDPI